VTKQLINLGIVARKYKINNVNDLPTSLLDKDGGESEHSDYCDEDFKDLMSIK